VNDFIRDYYLKNIDEVVAKLHFENIEKSFDGFIFSLGILFSDIPLSLIFAILGF
jgi:hypothetical protein